MNRNAIGIDVDRQTPRNTEHNESESTTERRGVDVARIQPDCPPWCVRHAGSGEGLGHYGISRQVAGYDVQLERHDPPGRGEVGLVEVCLDNASLTPEDAAALGAALTAAAQPDRRPMAAHHWTNVDGWESAARIRDVTTQDMTRDELYEPLQALCAGAEVDDGEGHGPVGALLVRRIDGGNPHLVMLAGQTPLEERITVHNVMWLLTCGEPAGSIVDHVEIPGQGTFGVVPIHCRSSVYPAMQPDTEALVAQLPPLGTATRTQRYQYRIGELCIVELNTMAHDRIWTTFRDLDTIAILAGLSEQDRRRALAEALTEMTAEAPPTTG